MIREASFYGIVFLNVLYLFKIRLATVSILGKERKPGVGKLGWNGNFDTEFERNTVSDFFELFCNIATLC